MDEKGKKVEDGYTFTVAETARSLANAKSSSKKLKKLTDAILNYGIYTQKQQNYKADNLVATDDLSDIKKSDLKNYAVKKSGEVNGISFVGCNLELKEEARLFLYFRVDDPTYCQRNIFFGFDDGGNNWYGFKNLGHDNLVYTTIDGISAQELSRERWIVIRDGKTKNQMSVTFSALSWARNVLNGKNYSKETVDLAKMLYRYSSAADQYFGK
jgi:hypothetical protein